MQKEEMLVVKPQSADFYYEDRDLYVDATPMLWSMNAKINAYFDDIESEKQQVLGNNIDIRVVR